MTNEKPDKFQCFLPAVQSLWFGVFLFSFVLQWFGLEDVWRYDREAVETGGYWLLLSGNLVHLNWTHWALNMAGLAIVAFFFSSYASVWQWLLVMLLSAIFVGVGVNYINLNIDYYVGLSGVLHGLFVFGALRETRVYPLSGYVLSLVLLAKLLWEFFKGALPGSEDLTGGLVLTDAHLYGAIGGLFSYLAIILVRYLRSQE